MSPTSQKGMRTIGHIVFWALSYVVIFIALSIDHDGSPVNHVMTTTFHLPLLMLVYLHQYLFRKLFLTKKIAIYCSILIILLILSGIFSHLLFTSWADTLLPNFFFVAQYTVSQVAAIHLTYVAVSFLLFLGFNWYTMRDRQQRLELEKKSMHLKSLRTQLNPHFLFNSLNNIYALAQSNHFNTSAYILKLSDSMRYMTYDADTDFVSLEDDLQQLKNYFELEKIRFDNADNIKLEIIGKYSGLPVAPLLFLPMVENAFKYIDASRPILICTVTIDKFSIVLHCENSIGETSNQDPGGIGLSNLRQRLELIYPDQYDLTIKEGSSSFSILLKIQIQ